MNNIEYKAIAYLRYNDIYEIVYSNNDFITNTKLNRKTIKEKYNNSFIKLFKNVSVEDLKLAYLLDKEITRSVSYLFKGKLIWLNICISTMIFEDEKCISVKMAEINDEICDEEQSFEDILSNMITIKRDGRSAVFILLSICQSVNDITIEEKDGIINAIKQNLRTADLVGINNENEMIVYLSSASSMDYILDRIVNIRNIIATFNQKKEYKNNFGIVIVPRYGMIYKKINIRAHIALKKAIKQSKTDYYIWNDLDEDSLENNNLLDSKRMVNGYNRTRFIQKVMNNISSIFDADDTLVMEYYNDTSYLCEIKIQNSSQEGINIAVSADGNKKIETAFLNDKIVFLDKECLIDTINNKYENVQKFGIVPLFRKSIIYGVILIINPKEETDYNEYIYNIKDFLVSGIMCELFEKASINAIDKDKFINCYNEYKFFDDIRKLDTIKLDSLGIFIANINQLKTLNHLNGQEYGNKLLKKIAIALEKVFGKNKVYRTSGDEFTVLLKNINYYDFATKAKRLEEFFEEDEKVITIGYTWEYEDINVNVVLKKAKNNLEANRSKENTPLIPSYVKNLLLSIKHKEFKMFMQPQMDLKTNKIIGYEGLVRLISTEDGFISPEKFIPLLEENNTIRFIDLFMFEEACKKIKEWKDDKKQIIPISINYSKITLLYYGLIRKMEEIRKKYDIEAKYIEIEITESVGELSSTLVIKLEQEFRQKGYSVILDDFGKGFSNIALLLKMTPNKIKIDKKLIDNIDNDENNKNVISYIIKMCHSLDIIVLAEGVERIEQKEALLQCNCDETQGFLDGHPLHVEEI